MLMLLLTTFSMVEQLTKVFVVLLVFSMVDNGYGACFLRDSVDDQVCVSCVRSLDSLSTCIPEYEPDETYDDYDDWGYSKARDVRPLNRIFNLKLTYVDLDSLWTSEYEYMNKNMRTLTLNKITSIPYKISSFNNLIKIKIDEDNELNEININVFLSLTNLIEISVIHSSVVTIHANQDSRTSNVSLIDLSNNLIESLPNSCFDNFLQLNHLNLSHNLINNFEILTFEGIQYLESLDVSFNRLKEVGHSFVRFVNVKILNLNYNNLTKIEEYNFATMMKLAIIDLSFNQLIEIEGKSFQNLKNMEELDFSNNKLTRMTKVLFQNNTKLQKLSLANNPIQNIESETFQGKNITYFNIDGIRLIGAIERNSFDGIITDHLNLSFGNISSLDPEAFSGLQTRTLNLSYNTLTNISTTSLKSIHFLEELDLSNNKLSSIYFETTDLKELLTFTAKNNNIAKISKSFFENLESLTKLDLSYNKISELDPVIFVNLSKLEKLYLANNNIVKLPPKFLAVSNKISFLQELTITNLKNQFSFEHIPDTSLSHIDMSYNDIEDMNAIFVFKINKLELLNMKFNKISSIDKFTFQYMPALTDLDLSYNLITYIQPGTFLHTNALKTLNLHGNSLPALQFGALDGLFNLETLNLSSNAIHEFGGTILHNLPTVRTLALDNNVIEHIKFEDLPSTIEKVTIGGNPLSCHIVADFKKQEHQLIIAAEILDFHSENVDGIKCMTKYKFNNSVSFPQNSTEMNGTVSFLLLAKAIDIFRVSIEKFSSTFDQVHSINESQAYVTQKNNTADHRDELKGVLYFIAVCLIISIILSLSSLVFKLLIKKKPLSRDGFHYCSSQPIANVMELQNT